MKILMVPEDDKTSASLKQIFDPRNLQIITAGSVRHGIKLIESDHAIDLIIINTKINGESGIALLSFLKKSPRYRWIPVIMISKNWSTTQVSECIDLGVNEMLAIPFNQELFKNKIENSLRNGKRRVLVVEDDSMLLDLLRNIFELERFHVLGAGSYEEAVNVLENDKVHLIITDILLPAETGFDLLKYAKKKQKNLPVVLVTGHSGKFKRKEAFAEGADGFFKKPFNNRELIQKARSLLSSHIKTSV